MTTRLKTAPDRFWAKVVFSAEPDGCWIWTGCRKAKKLYGLFTGEGGRLGLAHRWSYERAYGPIAPGLQIHHKCHNPGCVRPDHMNILSDREHWTLHPNRTLPAVEAATLWRQGRTHCKRGHEFTPENTYVSRSGSRVCRACVNAHKRRYRAAGKEACHD